MLYASATQGGSGVYTDFGILDGELAGTMDGYAQAGQVIEVSDGQIVWPSGVPTRFGAM